MLHLFDLFYGVLSAEVNYLTVFFSLEAFDLLSVACRLFRALQDEESASLRVCQNIIVLYFVKFHVRVCFINIR